jgi:hypothetical protein
MVIEYQVHISVCLSNPLYKATFRSFARKEKSEENIAFIEEVQKYRASPRTFVATNCFDKEKVSNLNMGLHQCTNVGWLIAMQLAQKARHIQETHLATTATQQVNLSDAITKNINTRITAADFTVDLFDRAYREITSMLQNE